MPKGDTLTPKQEIFCQCIIKGQNYTDAYKKAYSPKTTNTNSLNRIAFKTYYNVNIQSRIAELKGKIEAKLVYTAEQSFNKLSEIQQKALEFKKKIYTSKQEKPIELDNPDFKSAVKAEELKGKLTQLYTDKSEVNHSGIIVLNFDSEDKKA